MLQPQVKEEELNDKSLEKPKIPKKNEKDD